MIGAESVRLYTRRPRGRRAAVARALTAIGTQAGRKNDTVRPSNEEHVLVLAVVLAVVSW